MFKYPVFFIVAVILFILNCSTFQHFKTEAEKIHHEAEQLHEEAANFLPSAVRDAVMVGICAVKEAYKHSQKLDPQAIRFVAVTTATMTADEAIRTIIMKQVKHFDNIFGIDRSEEIASMLLSTYCFPVLNDVLTAEINYQINCHDPSYKGEKKAPDIDSIMQSHLGDFSIENAVKMVLGFGTEKKTPEYFSRVAMNTVNTDYYSATRNWKDHGLIYQYRIVEGCIEMKCGDGDWVMFDSLPFTGTPVSITADNNRFMVLTDDHELWWYCIKDDQAQWSIDIMKTAVNFMSLKPVVEGQICDVVLPVLVNVIDSVAIQASSVKYLGHWKTMVTSGNGSSAYWQAKCSFWTNTVLSLDRLFLKTGNGASFTAEDYAVWSSQAHKGGAWSNLLSWNSCGQTFTRGQNVDPEKITDIAIGNWNGTVVTDYIIADGKIWFLDEEIIQPEWKPIEQWNEKWALLGQKEYTSIADSPYPLDSTCRINASNSVISVIKKTADTSTIFWVRWDYHQKDDFVYWPLDWCEHAWHAVTCPGSVLQDFRISTIENIDPRESGTVWSIPAPAFTFHNYLPEKGYEGIFGDIPRQMVSIYPVDLYIQTAPDTILTFSAKHSDDIDKRNVSWKVVQKM